MEILVKVLQGILVTALDNKKIKPIRTRGVESAPITKGKSASQPTFAEVLRTLKELGKTVRRPSTEFSTIRIARHS